MSAKTYFSYGVKINVYVDDGRTDQTRRYTGTLQRRYDGQGSVSIMATKGHDSLQSLVIIPENRVVCVEEY